MILPFRISLSAQQHIFSFQLSSPPKKGRGILQSGKSEKQLDENQTGLLICGHFRIFTTLMHTIIHDMVK